MAISPDIMAGRRPPIPEYVLPKVSFVEDPEPHLQANELVDQRWFVTGAGRKNGIGAAIVDLAAQRGAHVVFAASPWGFDEARVVEAEYQAKGLNVSSIIGDLSAEGIPRHLMQTAIETLGGIDVVINNAGKPYDGEALKLTREQHEASVKLGLYATFEIKQVAIAKMIEQGRSGGLILDINSIAREGNRWQPFYAAVKAGQRAQNQSLNDELNRRYKIRFVDVESGLVEETNMAKDLPESLKKQLIQLPGGKRAVERDEVAHAVVIAASPRRSNNITRATLQVLGGEDYARYMIVPELKPQP